MKRPLPIYFVAAWCFLAMVVQVNGFVHLGERWFQDPDNRQFARSAGGLVDILIIWHTVRLIKLKKFNIWLSIVFFAVLTVVLYVNSFIVFFRYQREARLVINIIAAACLNIICLVYLVRPTFRHFAARFVAEKERPKNSEMIQKVAQKAVLKDLKGSRPQ